MNNEYFSAGHVRYRIIGHVLYLNVDDLTLSRSIGMDDSIDVATGIGSANSSPFVLTNIRGEVLRCRLSYGKLVTHYAEMSATTAQFYLTGAISIS